MKILLVTPPRISFDYGFYDFWEPLGLLTIVSELSDLHIFLYYSNLVEHISVDMFISSWKPDIVAISGFSIDEPQVLDICGKIRKVSFDTHIVIGGWYATVFPHAFFVPAVDFIVVGEGEETFTELVRHLEKKHSLSEISKIKGLYFQSDNGFFHFTGKRPFVDLNSFSPPRRDLYEPYRKEITSRVRNLGWKGFKDYEAPYLVQISRGCPHRCEFCAVWPFFEGKVRRKSLETLEREFESIPDTAYIKFVDDDFLSSPDSVQNIINLLKSKNYKGEFSIFARIDDIVKYPQLIEELVKVGLRNTLVGFEIFREKDQNKPYAKGIPFKYHQEAINILRQNGVAIQGSFIIDPDWDKKDFREFRDYLNKINLDFINFSPLTPFPGTILYRKLKKKIIINQRVDGFYPIVRTKLSQSDFMMELSILNYLYRFGRQ